MIVKLPVADMRRLARLVGFLFATVLLLAGEMAYAQTAPASHLSAAEQADFWEQRAIALSGTDNRGAIEALAKAIELEDRAYRRVELAQLLEAEGQNAAALEQLERANALEPNNPELHFALGYLYLKLENVPEAIVWFEKGLARNPSELGVQEDLAYAYKHQGENQKAIDAFKKVVDNEPHYPQSTEQEREETKRRIYHARSEITELDRQFYAGLYAGYRSGASSDIAAAPAASPGESHFGAEAGWRPEEFHHDGRMIVFYGRVYGYGQSDDSYKIDEESWQGGLGVRAKPFKEIDLQFGIERLFKIGDFSWDAWLFRSAYFWGDGGELKPYEDNWNFTSLYVDFAAVPDPRFTSVFFEGMQGRRYLIGDRTTVTPHIVLSAYETNDPYQSTTNVEAGPGVSLTYYGHEDKYHAPRSTTELRLQYRLGLHTDSGVTDDAWVLGLFVTF